MYQCRHWKRFPLKFVGGHLGIYEMMVSLTYLFPFWFMNILMCRIMNTIALA